MADNDPDTNGGLPPKISLKPKTDVPQSPVAPKQDSAPTAAPRPTLSTEPHKPITLRKPISLSGPKPLSPSTLHTAKPISDAEVTAPPAATPVETPPAAAAKPDDIVISPPTAAPTETPETPKPPTVDTAPHPTQSAPAKTTPETPDPEPITTEQPITAAEAPQTEEEQPAAPKRPVLRPVLAGATTIKRPASLGIRKDGPDPLAAPGTKKSTSRITLPPIGEKSATGEIKTIKIAPRSKTAPIEEQGENPDAEPGKPAVTADPKRQTSRISLESALGSQSPTAPATIKIKRAPVGNKPAPAANTVATDDTTAPGDAPETVSATDKPESQKKTLKVRRASAAPSDRPSVAAGSPMFTPPVATPKFAEPAPHWAFAIVAIAATLIAGVLIYVLVAQVTEPDLVELPPPDAGMPWPGRLII